MQNLPICRGFAVGIFCKFRLRRSAKHTVAEDAKTSDLAVASQSEFFSNSATKKREAHRSGRCKIFRFALASRSEFFANPATKKREAHRSGRCKIFRFALASRSEFFANPATKKREAHRSGRCKNFRSCRGFAVGIFFKFRLRRSAKHTVAEDAKSSDLALASRSEFFANSATEIHRNAVELSAIKQGTVGH